MSAPDPTKAPRLPLPNYRTPRLLGICNVLFSSQILICGLAMAPTIVATPYIMEALNGVVKQVEAQAESRKVAEIAAIDEDIKAAETDEAKTALEARRKEVEARPNNAAMPGMMDMSKMGLDDPTLVGWSWAEVISGIVLNVMMLVGGVGLMNWRPWALKLSVWTAVLKILRLVVLYAIFVVVVVPPMGKRMAEMAADMVAQQQVAMGRPASAAPSMDVLATIYTVTYSSMGVMMALGGVIYPAIVIWLLRKPAVKLACSGTYLPPKEPKQP